MTRAMSRCHRALRPAPRCRLLAHLAVALACGPQVGCSSSESSPCPNVAQVADGTLAPFLDVGDATALHILLYTFSTGYRHASIPAGIAAIRGLAAASGASVEVKGTLVDARGAYCANQPDPAAASYFRKETLDRYAAVVFLNTTTAATADSTLLDDVGKAALEAYIRAGGGFVGVHAAADAEYGWSFYHELLGATFLGHGPPVAATLLIEDAAHPATRTLPNPWVRYDEWYDFTASPRSTAHVLVSLDEASYPNNPAPMGDHPIVWCKTIGAGRAFYTGLGHDVDAFRDPDVQRHLWGGILYAAGLIPADCSLSDG
jgi:type 1 glutamine amidotransferase